MNPLSDAALGQLMQFPSGNGAVLPLGWGAHLEGKSFVLVVSRVLRLMDFSVFLFYFSVLLIIQKTKSSCQQGLIDDSCLSPSSQSPNSCSPDSLVLCEEKEVLRVYLWNFILRTN